jgi:hypothetical protein
LENDAKLADARVAAQVATFDQLKSQAATINEDDVQLRALEREAKAQRDLLESYLAKYREASARDSIAAAPADARVISRATVSTVRAYPKKLPTIAIASLATLVLMSGIVLTRELLDSPAAGPRRVPTRRGRGGQDDTEPEADMDARVEPDAKAAPVFARPIPAERADGADRIERTQQRQHPDAAGALAARLRSIVRRQSAERDAPYKEPPFKEPSPTEPPYKETAFKEPSYKEPAHDKSQQRQSLQRELPPVSVPLSAIDEFAHNLHLAGVERSQIAFFAAAPGLDSGWAAVQFARALGRDARAVLVELGGNDEAIREISMDPGAPGLAALTAGLASFGDIITRDVTSNLNLIAAGHGASRSALLAASGMARHFTALAHAYSHVVIDAGLLGGRDGEHDVKAIAGISTHAMLLVDALAGDAIRDERDRLLDAGFDNVTIVTTGRAERAAA